MDRRLIELHVENFRSLRAVTLPLGPLNVLVGPNGAGKTNVLDVFGFLADVNWTTHSGRVPPRSEASIAGRLQSWGFSRCSTTPSPPP